MKKLLLALLLAASFGGEALAQATTGRVTTNAPTYLNNSTSPFSLQPDGDVRMAIEDAITATISGTVAATQSGTWTVAVTGVATAANQTTEIGHLDGLETLIGTTNANLDAVEIAVDAVTAEISSNVAVSCNGRIAIADAVSGDSELIALTASNKIYICGFWIASPAGTSNVVSLLSGTGTNCATSTDVITGTHTLGSVIPGYQDPGPFHKGLNTNVGEALCLRTTASAAIEGDVYYTIAP